MNEQTKYSSKRDKKIIFAPLSILASIAAFIAIPSISGAFVCIAIGVGCGMVAVRNNQKTLGIIGIILNLVVLIGIFALLFALASNFPE